MANDWFETVLEARRRAKWHLPRSVYLALVAGPEQGTTMRDNEEAFSEIGLAPHVVGLPTDPDLTTTIMGQSAEMPVMISPTGVQAVHPEGELAVARAAANRGVPMGPSAPVDGAQHGSTRRTGADLLRCLRRVDAVPPTHVGRHLVAA